MKASLFVLLIASSSFIAQTILTQFDGDIGTGGNARSQNPLNAVGFPEG